MADGAPSSIMRRQAALKQALTLQYLTLAWMVVEVVVAIGSGLAAHSVTLIAFGADSVIELLSASLLVWRLAVELRHGADFSEEIEARAAKLAAALLAALTLYVLASAAWSLWQGRGQDFSLPGLALTALAIPIMYGLGRKKLTLAEAIGSAALRADAIESVACLYLSAVVMVGLLAQRIVGAWWIDGATALCLVPFLVHEAREAWEGEDAD